MLRLFLSLACIAGRIFRATDGGAAVLFAIVLPTLGISAVGSVDFWCVVSDRTNMQKIADAAALSAASQLLVDSSTATAQRAEAVAKSQLQSLLGAWTLQLGAQVVDNGNGVQVTISGNRPSMILGLIPSDGWNVSVSATAQKEGSTPLCALGIASSSLLAPVFDLSNSAQLTAPDCLVQSNQNLDVTSGAMMTTGVARATGTASGNISPSPQNGAPAIPDPFASMNVSVPSLCTDVNFSLTNGPATLAPGVHCGVIRLTGPSTLTLLPGTHYFLGAVVTLTGSALLQGTGVTLVFDATSYFSFTGSSGVSLIGANSGPFAGFVLITSRDNVSTFTISTNYAHVLEGVAYLPSATLSLPGYGPVAESSAWTVIVAHDVSVSGTANLTLNTNYSGSSVPVPSGVGPSSEGEIVLTH